MAKKTPNAGKQRASATTTSSQVDFFADQINRSWNKAFDGIFAVGDLLRKAKRKLSVDGYDELVQSNRLPFCGRVAQMLAKISTLKHYRQEYFKKHLPLSWTILHTLRDLTPQQLRKAIEDEKLSHFTTRIEAEALVLEITGKHSKQTNRKLSSQGINQNSKQMTLIFSIPEEIKNFKTGVDIQFFYSLAEKLFNNIPEKRKVAVDQPAKLSRNLHSSYSKLDSIIEKAREVENYHRRKAGKKPLTDLQAVLSLLGADPDRLPGGELAEIGFSMMERIVLAYARRNGLDLDENELKWFARKPGVPKVLQGSFQRRLEKEVASILSGKKPKRKETKIIQLDSDESELNEFYSTESADARH